MDDVSRYYKNTVCTFTDVQNVKHLGYLTRVDYSIEPKGDDSDIYALRLNTSFNFKSKLEEHVIAIKATTDSIEPYLPEVGYVNIKEEKRITYPIMLTKTGERQYKKSFGSGLYQSINPFYNLLHSSHYLKKTLSSIFVSETILSNLILTEDITKPKYYFYEQATFMMEKNKNIFGVALSPKFCLFLGFTSEKAEYTLFWDILPVAEISGNNLYILELELTQEIYDFLRRSGTYLNVN